MICEAIHFVSAEWRLSMSNINLDQIDNMQFDVLKEIGNIGAGNATTALSKMINGKVDMSVPEVALLEFKELPDMVGGAENIVVGILIQFEDFTELELSALQEIGNIISGAYLSSLSTLINIRIDASIPYMSIDMAGAILSVPAIEFGKVGDKALMIETKFSKDESDVKGYFILIPTLESYNVILKSLGL